MKVRITTNLTDVDRLMIGAIRYGELGTPASHEDCVTFLEEVNESGLEPLRLAWERQTKDILASISESLDRDG